MKQGSLLEITLRIIQESLKTDPKTEVISNYKIKNTSGREREFDVAIRAEVNGFEILAVIECKDYISRVSVEKIEAFHSKCLRIPAINKKIFVSRSGYQADAINAATEFGIEIYDVEEIDLEKVKHWLAVSFIKPYNRYMETEKLSMGIEPREGLDDLNYQTTLFDELSGNGAPLSDFVHEILDKTALTKPVMTFGPIDDNKVRKHEYRVEATEIKGKYFLNKLSNKCYLINMIVFVSITEEDVDAKINIERVKSWDKYMSTVVSHNVSDKETIKLVVNDDGTRIDPFIVNNESGEIHDSGFTFKYVKIDE